MSATALNLPAKEKFLTETLEILFALLHTGRVMTPESVRGLLVKYRNQAGIKTSVSPHTWRRTCATHLLQNGADIRYIQELLGHQSLKTTQSYTKIMPREVKQTHDRTHPGIGPSQEKT